MFVIFILTLCCFQPNIVSSDGIKAWGIRALTILVAGCPCSLIMATPLAMVSGITNAAKNGMLVKGLFLF